MVTLSQCKKKGLEKQVIILVETMNRRYSGFITWDHPYGQRTFSHEQVEDAFNSLGVDFKNTKGRKWYQFWKNNFNEKVFNALKVIPIAN